MHCTISATTWGRALDVVDPKRIQMYLNVDLTYSFANKPFIAANVPLAIASISHFECAMSFCFCFKFLGIDVSVSRLALAFFPVSSVSPTLSY